MTGPRASRAVLLSVVVALAVGLSSVGRDPAEGARRPAPAAPVPVHADGLHNVFRVSRSLYSGSGPDGDRGFASLHALGVRTVLSVDGAAPDVAAAKAHGLRYVHLPVGYDGIPRETAWAIAKAVRDLPGPVYVHCHYGKHRGPAAAACAMMALDPAVTPRAAEDWLKAAGTDPKYAGLVALPRTLRRPTPRDLAALPAEFPEAAPVPDLTRLMVAVDGRWEHLKAANAAGWKSPPSHPDVDPRHEAVQLAELYREAARLPSALGRGEPFLDMLKQAETAADELQQALSSAPTDFGRAKTASARSQAACSRCHTRFRD